MLEGTQSAFTSLFDNSVLHQIERMRLRPQRRLTNRARGEHLSGKGGSSTDFADFRDYAAGDDLRYVDWNILRGCSDRISSSFSMRRSCMLCCWWMLRLRC